MIEMLKIGASCSCSIVYKKKKLFMFEEYEICYPFHLSLVCFISSVFFYLCFNIMSSVLSSTYISLSAYAWYIPLRLLIRLLLLVQRRSLRPSNASIRLQSQISHEIITFKNSLYFWKIYKISHFFTFWLWL